MRSAPKKQDIRSKRPVSTAFSALRMQRTPVLLAMAAALFSFSCSSQPKKKTNFQSNLPEEKKQGNAVPQQEQGKVPFDDASLALKSQAVGRVIGFASLEGSTVTVYQDAASALAPGASEKPIYYYSPVFAAGPMTAAWFGDELRVNIKNRYTQEDVRAAIASQLSTVLAKEGIDVAQIGLLKFSAEGVTGTANFFGEELAVKSVNNDFTMVTLAIPKQHASNAGLKPEAPNFESLLKSSLSKIALSYAYYAQESDTQSCKLNIDFEQLKDITSDEGNCPKPEQFLPAQKDLEPAKLAVGDLQRAAKIETLLAQSQRPLSACVAFKRLERLRSKTNIQCAKPKTNDKGEVQEFDPMIIKYLFQTAQPLSANINKRGSGEIEQWDDELIAASIRLFGSPERFQTVLRQVKDAVENNVDQSWTENQWTDIRKVFNTLKQYDHGTGSQSKSSDQTDTDTGSYFGNHQCKSRSLGGGVSVGGVGVNANTSKSDCKSSQAERDFDVWDSNTSFKDDFGILKDILQANDENRQIAVSEQLQKKIGFLAEMRQADGEFKFFPPLNIMLNASEDALKNMQDENSIRERGFIKQQKESISVNLNQIQDQASLTVQLKGCHNETVVLQPGWRSSAKIWDDLAAKFNAKLTTMGGCSTLESISVYFSKDLSGSSYGMPEFAVSIQLQTNDSLACNTSLRLQNSTQISAAQNDSKCKLLDASTKYTKIQIGG